MAVSNGDFKTAGLQRYEAADWQRAQGGAYQWSFAAFRVEVQDVDAKESFDAGYGYKLFAYEGFFQDLEQAYFNASVNAPTPVEGFETRWGTTGAKLKAGNLAPYALAPGMTLVLLVLDEEQTITFASRDFMNIASALQGEVVNAINAQIRNARADVEYGFPIIVTDKLGPGAHLRKVGGTAADLFDFPDEEQQGQPEAGAFYREVEFTYLPLDGFEHGYNAAGTGTYVSESKPPTELREPDTFAWQAVNGTLTVGGWGPPEAFVGWQLQSPGYLMATAFYG